MQWMSAWIIDERMMYANRTERLNGLIIKG